MATYQHGVYNQEQATSLTTPIRSSAALQVIFGTAPVHLADDPTKAANTLKLCYSFAECQAAVGYSDDFKNFTLCQSIDANFRVFNNAPIVLVNVLDPGNSKHTKNNGEESCAVTNGQAVYKKPYVLLHTMVVKKDSSPLEADVDYTAAHDDDGNVVITLISETAKEAESLMVSSTSLNPAGVTKEDVVGGVDTGTGKETGLELVRQIYEMLLKIAGKTDSSLKAACNTAAKNIDALGKTAKNAGKMIAGAAAAGAAAVGTIGVAAVKAASDYEAQLANVATLLTGTEAEVAARTSEIGSQIMEVSNRTGVATADLTDGMYQVVSAFGDSADAASILETAAKSAAAGNATTTDSINLLSAVTKGYGDTSAEAVQKAADLSFATVRLGQTTFPELAAAMGKVIPLASTLGVEQEQLFGAMATLTGVTGSTAEVVTQLKATMQGFLSPSKNMSAALQSMGYESGQALLESEGLQGALEALKKSVGGNELAFAGLFSSVEAQTAVLAMAGTQAENLTSKTAEMYEATGAANTAFERQTDTLAYDIQMIKNLGANFLTELGTNILPYVRELTEAALPVVQEALGRIGDYMTGVILPAAETAVKWVSENKDLILALAAGILTAVAAYKAYKLAVTAYNAVMGVYKVVTEASATGTFTLAGAMTALNLPVLAVVAAIAAVVAIGVLLYKNWAAVIAKAAELGAQIAQVFGNIKNWVTTTISNLVAAFQANFPMLSAFITGWWQSIQAAVENVKDIFTNIIEFVKNVFTGNWEGAWDNIVNIFGNLFGMIVNLAKAPINGVISAINWVLEKINSISVTIPDWVPLVGGQTLGFNIPTIPALAAGGIATAPTLAMIGEGGEPEAVMPLSKLAALLDEWNKPKPQGGGDPEDGDGNRIVWSPVFHFYGNTTKEEAVEAARMSFAEFKKMYKQMKAEERRKKFAPA